MEVLDGEALLAKLGSRLEGLRGSLTPNAAMNAITWFRAGGMAEVLFQPADEEDLAAFMRAIPEDIPVTAVGVGSNLLVRDGGIPGFVIRPAVKGFGQIGPAILNCAPVSGFRTRCLRRLRAMRKSPVSIFITAFPVQSAGPCA